MSPKCLGVSPAHLRHSRVSLRVPSVSLSAGTPPFAGVPGGVLGAPPDTLQNIYEKYEKS